MTIRLEALRTDPDHVRQHARREEGRSDDDWRAWLGRGATFLSWKTATIRWGLIVAVANDEGDADLYAMFVSPRARRLGVGRALVAAGTAWAAEIGARRVVLMVIEGNTRAISLYESCGFAFTGLRQSRDRDGATELEMARVIRIER